jgi:hypothetical protein
MVAGRSGTAQPVEGDRQGARNGQTTSGKCHIFATSGKEPAWARRGIGNDYLNKSAV